MSCPALPMAVLYVILNCFSRSWATATIEVATERVFPELIYPSRD
ncbi:MAG: hypothetical protein QXH07_06840 [Thermoplasmata archaeon]